MSWNHSHSHLPACGQSVRRALKWEIPFGTHLAKRSRCTESLIFHDILCTAHVFSFLLLLSSDSGCSCPAPALSPIVSVCASHSCRLKTNLARDYEWKCKMLCLNAVIWCCLALSLWAGSILLEYAVSLDLNCTTVITDTQVMFQIPWLLCASTFKTFPSAFVKKVLQLWCETCHNFLFLHHNRLLCC